MPSKEEKPVVICAICDTRVNTNRILPSREELSDDPVKIELALPRYSKYHHCKDQIPAEGLRCAFLVRHEFYCTDKRRLAIGDSCPLCGESWSHFFIERGLHIAECHGNWESFCTLLNVILLSGE